MAVLSATVMGAGAGAGIGIMQWRILRHQIAKTGWWWILTNMIGWAVALLVARGVNLMIQNSVGAVFAGVVGGILIGIVTGITLFWLLKHPPESQSEKSG
jgi:hypothetical protein